MKKLLLKLSILCMISFTFVISMSSIAFADDTVVDSGTCGENVKWALTGEEGNMALTISGTGAMDNYSGSGQQPWVSHKNEIKAVTIEEGVTAIGPSVFRDYGTLVNVSLPESLTTIEQYAFCRTGITSIEIPASVTTIGGWAFSECRNLNTVVLNDGLKKISRDAFSATYITNIVIPDTVTSIEANAFYANPLKKISLPGSAASTFSSAFSSCSNLDVTITSGLEVVDSNSGFQKCELISSITLPKGVTKIGSKAFYECGNLKQIELPNSITEIDKQAFHGCTSLQHAGTKKGIRAIGEQAFMSCGNLESIDIPDTVLTIGKYAFSNCLKLESIHIPNRLTTIEERTFDNCRSLKTVEIPSSVKSIGDSAFNGCAGLTGITIPSSVEQIGRDAVTNSDLLYIYCEEGSVAEQFAVDGNYRYDLMTGHKFEEANVIDEQAATCTEDGILLYYCPTCRRNIEEAIPAAHDWGEPSYAWSKDNKTVTATRTCKKDNAHTDTEMVETSSVITKKATYTAKGQTTYTATFKNSAFSMQTKTVEDIDKLSKKTNTLTVKTKVNKVKYKKLKKKNQAIAAKKAFVVSKAKGKVTYKKASGNAKIKVNKAGKITIKKGLKKGTYKVKVKVSAAGDIIYKPVSRTVTVTIKVK